MGWCYRLGPGLTLRTSRPPGEAQAAERVILIHSRGAFPPSHPATRLTLDLLRQTLAEAQAASFLDVGSGSGVLCLAAAALGVGRVVGVDLAWEAARATRDNARGNGLAPPVFAVQGTTACLQGPFEVVAANLHAEVHQGLTAELDRLAGGCGRLILAGFRDNQEAALLSGYQDRSWRLARRLAWNFAHPTLPPDLSFTWAAWLLVREAP
jgi:ribosomal protein L11 methyltransferase